MRREHLVMTDLGSSAQALADNINPVLALLVAVAPFVRPRHAAPIKFWVGSIAAIGLPVALAEAGKAVSIWPGQPSFPSGHETFALAAGTCLAFRSLSWLWIALPLCALLAWALVAAQYHQPLDTVGALVLGPPIAWLCLRRLTVDK